MLGGTVITESRMAATIAKATRAAEAEAYERGKLAGRAEEREACAVVCDELRHPLGARAETTGWIDGTVHCAQAIRARGQKEKAGD